MTDLWLRPFMVGFFVLYGVILAVNGARAARSSEADGFDGQDGSDRARLARARAWRLGVEAAPYLGLATSQACFSWFLAIVTASTKTSLSEVYALNTAFAATALTIVLARVKRRGRRRFATLAVRTPRAAAPAALWAAATATAALPLLWFSSAPAIAAIVTLSGLLALRLAWHVAVMPALLGGDDIPAETFVDDQFRRARTAPLLGLAIAPGYVFIAFAPPDGMPVHRFAFIAAGLALATMLWFVRKSLREPCRPDLAPSFHAI